LRYGDRVIVESRFVACDAAKIIFDYTLFNAETKEIVAKGSSLQVFLDKETSTLQLTVPAFFEEWKKKHGLI
jgi:acyl-CoA thioester hydrolase